MVDTKALLTKWRAASLVELKLELQELIKQQFKLKMQHAIGELKTTHQLKNIRRNIARILGLLTEKGAK